MQSLSHTMIKQNRVLEFMLGVFGDMGFIVIDMPINTLRKSMKMLFDYPKELYLAIKEEIRYNQWIKTDRENSITVFTEMRERNKLYTDEDVLRSNLGNLRKQRDGRYDL